MWGSSLSRLNPLSTKVLTTNSEGQSSLDAASYSASSIFSSSALYSCSWPFAAELLSVHIPAERPRTRSAYLRWASRAHRPRVDDIDLFCHAAWPSLQTLETAKNLEFPPYSSDDRLVYFACPYHTHKLVWDSNRNPGESRPDFHGPRYRGCKTPGNTVTSAPALAMPRTRSHAV
jgi:hypothetical protein